MNSKGCYANILFFYIKKKKLLRYQAQFTSNKRCKPQDLIRSNFIYIQQWQIIRSPIAEFAGDPSAMKGWHSHVREPKSVYLNKLFVKACKKNKRMSSW